MNFRSWGARGAISILDQGLFSGANFALSVCLARWLSTDQYGAFSVSLAVFLFASSFYNGLVLEPMSVLGPQRRQTERAYTGTLVMVHCFVTLCLGLIVAGAGALLHANGAPEGPGVEMVGLTLPLILLYWLLRRVFYLQGDPARAALSSFCYAVSLAIFLILVRRSPTVRAGILAMAAAAAIASVAAFPVEALRWDPRRLWPNIVEHWKYGRWVVGMAFFYWLSGPFFAPILGYFSGLSGAATFRAAENLFLALSQMMTALSLLAMPQLSEYLARKGEASLRRISSQLCSLALLMSGAYCAAVLMGGRALIVALYAGSRYAAAFALLPLLCVATIVGAVADFGVGLPLKAAARPDTTFWATAAAAFVSFFIGIPLVRRFGPAGAAWATLIATTVEAAFLLWRFLAITKQSPEPSANFPAVAPSEGA